jgi:hypothetical protein
MTPDKFSLLVAVIAISLIPFAIWGALALARGVYGANLRPLLRWLRLLRWMVWIIGFPFVVAAVLSDKHHWLLPIGISLVTFSGGLSFPQGWIKRHYAPKSPDSEDGWWPTART